MSNILELNCLVFGDDSSHIFPVEILRTASVGVFKKVIKEEKKPEFDHICADSLVLWDVKIPLNESLQESLSNHDFVDEESLLPVDRLSDVFLKPPIRKHLHIVVKAPLTSRIPLFCYVKGDRYQQAFEVEIGMEASVSALQKAIKEAKKPIFDHISADSLALWSVEIPFNKHLKEAVNILSIANEEPLLPLTRLFNVVPHPPAAGHIHIVVNPIATKSPSSSDSRPRWLVEIHRKLWGRRDLYGQIFRTATLTKADFIDLQCQLQEQNPDRNSESYVATNVLAIKLAFLHSRSTPAPVGAGFGDCLVPRLVFGASQGLTQPPTSGIMNDDDADAEADDTMEIDPDPGSYIESDAICLSTGTAAIFPCTIQYMDLTDLELEDDIRVPQLMLIRKEWGTIVDIFNKREKGIKGSAVFTGQPGIGKTCLLYCILIHCIIHAQPIVFQDVHGHVFIIDDTVRRQMGTPNIPINDVLTLVDANGAFCQPRPCLLEAANLRILLTSLPRNRKDRKWLTQFVAETTAVFVMEPWSREELLVAALFLTSIDITLKRFQETSDICGLIPRPCFEAAKSVDALRSTKSTIIDAIQGIENLSEAMVYMHSRSATIHHAFQIRPSPESRFWECCLIEAVSDWAFSKIMAHLNLRSADVAYKFYCAINSSPLGRKIFENKLHPFFRTITEPRTFTIHSLDDHSTTFDIEFSSTTEHTTFGTIQTFAGQLASSVGSNKSCYLKPLSPVFPTFDSFLYQHGMSQSDYSPLIGLQVATAAAHPISIKGLEKVQKSLDQQNAHLKDLRPSNDRKLIILFVVPRTMGVSFKKQKITGAEKVEHWYEKTSQFVLALPEKEVFQVK